jgi:hypothetical protein
MLSPGPKRDSALPEIIPGKRTHRCDYFCREVIEGKQFHSQPDYTYVHQKAAERNSRKTAKLNNIVPASILEREIFIQDITDQDPATI